MILVTKRQCTQTMPKVKLFNILQDITWTKDT